MLRFITFQITGQQRLACTGCEQRVRRLLEALPGVMRVSADTTDQRIEVVFETTRLAADAIAERLVQTGYQTRVESPDGPATRSPPQA